MIRSPIKCSACDEEFNTQEEEEDHFVEAHADLVKLGWFPAEDDGLVRLIIDPKIEKIKKIIKGE